AAVSNEACPLCLTALISFDWVRGADWRSLECHNCGRFRVSHDLLAKWSGAWRGSENMHARAVLSHAVRRMQRETTSPMLDADRAKSLLDDDYLPTPAEQVDLLLCFIGDTLGVPGKRALIKPITLRATIGAESAPGVIWALQALQDSGLAEIETTEGG